MRQGRASRVGFIVRFSAFLALDVGPERERGFTDCLGYAACFTVLPGKAQLKCSLCHVVIYCSKECASRTLRILASRRSKC